MSRTYFLLLIGVLCFSFIWASVPSSQNDLSSAVQTGVSLNATLPSYEETDSPASPKKDVYMTAREHNGFLCIFSPDDNETPYLSLDVRIDSLPKADRDMFKAGVPLYTKAELSSLIEDYTS